MSETIDITNFETEVIEKSREIPVLVDFWAPWCQPCRILGPVLEEIAAENDGRLILAKLNTDEYQDVAQQYSIRGIPAVKLFINGKIEMEFTGALPKSNITRMLEKFLPDDFKLELEEIKKNLHSASKDELIKRLNNLVQNAPDLTEAKTLLAQTILFEQPEKANELLSGIMEDSLFYHQADSLRLLAELVTMKNEDIEKSPVREKLIRAIAFIRQKEFDQALDLLISIIISDKSYMDEIARKACVAIFTYLGNDHEISMKYRRRFNMSLY